MALISHVAYQKKCLTGISRSPCAKHALMHTCCMLVMLKSKRRMHAGPFIQWPHINIISLLLLKQEQRNSISVHSRAGSWLRVDSTVKWDWCPGGKHDQQRPIRCSTRLKQGSAFLLSHSHWNVAGGMKCYVRKDSRSMSHHRLTLFTSTTKQDATDVTNPVSRNMPLCDAATPNSVKYVWVSGVAGAVMTRGRGQLLDEGRFMEPPVTTLSRGT